MAGIGFGIAVVVVAGITQFIAPRSVVAPQPVVPEPIVVEINSGTTTPVVSEVTVSPSRPTVAPPSIAKGDTIASWSFTGAYTNNPELIAKANAEIISLSGLLETATSSRTSLLVAVANQYELLGEGKNEYNYLSLAIAEGGEKTGLPWHNLGALMERLGALETARAAYQKATIVQPQYKQWHFAYLEFLTTRMKDNVTDVEKAFNAAFTNLGQDEDILALQSAWKTQ